MKPYRINELAQKYVEYDMISTHTVLPEFPGSRVRLLYTFLNDRDSGKSNCKAETCALAAFLVQLGLDTHDKIDLEINHQDERNMRSRQLKVLAGDYFSGVFYELLAQAGEIKIVSLMSTAICEVNRLKVNLYTKLKGMLLSAEDYLKEHAQLKMTLFLSFTNLLDKSVHNVWRLLLAELSRCEVIFGEMKSSGELPQHHQGYAYFKIMETGTFEDKETVSGNSVADREWIALLAKYNVKEQLTVLLNQSIERTQLLINECKSEAIRSELMKALEPFIEAVSPPCRSLQEG